MRAGPASVSAARAAADAAVAEMYAAHYQSLVGLAVLLVRDGTADTAQRVVQDSFVALHRNWRALAARDDGDVVLYLWQFVLNRSRAAGRPAAPPSAGRPAALPSAGAPAAGLASAEVLTAMHALPPRQREALVLQHYAGLSGAQTAQMLGISADAVQRQTSRAMLSLQGILGTSP